MNKRLKKIFRIYYQLNGNVWANFHQYKKAKVKRSTSSRSKLASLNIINNKAYRTQDLNKYSSLQQIKKYYLNVSKKFITKIVNKKNIFILRYNSLLNAIESRLDVIVYRTNWCRTMLEARQMINHGMFLINGKSTNMSNLIIKKGDLISVNKEYIDHVNKIINNRIDQSQINVNVPDYIEVNYSTLECTLLYYPEPYQIPYPTISKTSSLSDFLC